MTFPNAGPSALSPRTPPPTARTNVVPFRARSAVRVASRYAAELDGTRVRRINCDDCVLVDTNACSECIVTFVLANEVLAATRSHPSGASVQGRGIALSVDEYETLGLLQASGLAPESNFAVRPVSLVLHSRAR